MTRFFPISGVLLFASSLLGANDPAAPDVAAFDHILKRYVLDDGTVKYAALKAGLDPLTGFVQQIGAVSPDSNPSLFPSRAHKLAYWLNAYNALVLWEMAKEYPEKKDRLNSLIGRYQFFVRTKFKAGGRDLSLREIETNAIRKQFQGGRRRRWGRLIACLFAGHRPAPPPVNQRFGLQARHCGLGRRQQHLYLGLHGLQRFHQAMDIHSAHTSGMEQQAAFYREYAQCEQEPLPDDSLSQIAPIFGGVDHQHLASL